LQHSIAEKVKKKKLKHPSGIELYQQLLPTSCDALSLTLPGFYIGKSSFFHFYSNKSDSSTFYSDFKYI
jgi:hypothetical protein